MSVGIKYDENNRYWRWLRKIVIIIVSLALLLLVWWVIAELEIFETIPTPQSTIAALVDLIQNGAPQTGLSLWSQVCASLVTFAKGTIMAVVVAVPLGLLLGYVRPLYELASPIIEVLRPIAPVAWAPIFISTRALGFEWGPALVVFMGMIFPLLTNTIFGVQRIDSAWVDAAKTMGAGSGKIFVKVILPASVPYVLNGLKTALGVGWMCIVASEIYATSLGGIGGFIYSMTQFSLWSYAFAGIIVVAVLGLLTTSICEYISKYVSKRMGME